MKIQVLVATMEQTDHSLPQKMGIQCDAIIGNQCDYNSIETFEYRVHTIKYLNFAERGVGLNRNNALMRATGDICLFADDDMVYCEDYIEIIRAAFEEHPNADVIVFNLKEKNAIRKLITKESKVGYLNYLRYGTARLAVKRSSVIKNGIFFNTCFGGGTEHCHGEDTLFLNACLKNKLKVIAVPKYIASLTDERASSWNNGYNEKYIRDQGILFHTLSRRWWKLLCLQDSVRRHKSYGMGIWKAFRMMVSAGKTV